MFNNYQPGSLVMIEVTNPGTLEISSDKPFNDAIVYIIGTATIKRIPIILWSA